MLFRLIDHKMQGAPVNELDAAGVKTGNVIFYTRIDIAIDGAPSVPNADGTVTYRFVQTDYVNLIQLKSLTGDGFETGLETKAKNYIVAKYGTLAP